MSDAFRFLAYLHAVPLLTSEHEVREGFQLARMRNVTFSNQSLNTVDVTIEFESKSDWALAHNQRDVVLQEVSCLLRSEAPVAAPKADQSDVLNEYLSYMDDSPAFPLNAPVKPSPVIPTEPPFVCRLENVPLKTSFFELGKVLAGYSVIAFNMPTPDEPFASVTFDKREDLVSILERTDLCIGSTPVQPSLDGANSIDAGDLEAVDQSKTLSSEVDVSIVSENNCKSESSSSSATVSTKSEIELSLDTDSELDDASSTVTELNQSLNTSTLVSSSSEYEESTETLVNTLNQKPEDPEHTEINESNISIKDESKPNEPDQPNEETPETLITKHPETINIKDEPKPNEPDQPDEKTPEPVNTEQSPVIFQSINSTEIPFYPPFVAFIYGFPADTTDDELIGVVQMNATVLELLKYTNARDGGQYLKIEFGRRMDLVQLIANKGQLNVSLHEVPALKRSGEGISVRRTHTNESSLSSSSAGINEATAPLQTVKHILPTKETPVAKAAPAAVAPLASNNVTTSTHGIKVEPAEKEVVKQASIPDKPNPVTEISLTGKTPAMIINDHAQTGVRKNSTTQLRDHSAGSNISKKSNKSYYYKKYHNKNPFAKNGGNMNPQNHNSHQHGPVSTKTGSHQSRSMDRVERPNHSFKQPFDNRPSSIGHPTAHASIGKGMCLLCNQSTDMTCGRCGRFYCTIMCQHIDWPDHSRICSKIPELIPYTAFQLKSASAAVIPALKDVAPVARPQSAKTVPPSKPIFTTQVKKPSTSPQHKPTVVVPKVVSTEKDTSNKSPFNPFKQKPTCEVKIEPRKALSSINHNTSLPNLAPALPAVKPIPKQPTATLPMQSNNVATLKANPSQTVAPTRVGPQQIIKAIPSQATPVAPLQPPTAKSNPTTTYNNTKNPFVNGQNTGKHPPATPMAKTQIPSTPTSNSIATAITQVASATSTLVSNSKLSINPTPPLTHQPMLWQSISIPYCDIPPPGSDVTITEVINAKHIFIRPFDEATNKIYLKTIADIATYANNYSSPLDRMPVLGQVVLARNPEHPAQFRRAIVLKINELNLIVAFIDYGNMSVVTLGDCHDLAADLQKLRRFVHRCTVAVAASADDTVKMLKSLKGSALRINYEAPFNANTIVRLSYKSSGFTLDQIVLNSKA